MRYLGLNELRSEFLDFFEEKGHNRLDSFSLVPVNDNSLLLINAGMAPLKDYFTGKKKMVGDRAVSSQKCIRTADIDRVGKTDRHGTFFEMLGNFSFGDYFKKEAIAWAWLFLTKKLEMDPGKLWVSVYEDDDEAYEIWNKCIGVPAERIVRLGKADNFWELEVGPCGPCSEIYVDRGEEVGCGDPNCKPGCDCDRFIEVWNLVFTQFDKDSDGNYNPLDNPNIDTGMGLERLAMVVEGVDNIFEVAVIRNIIAGIERLSGKEYHTDKRFDESIRVISDHTRAITFMVADGVVPSNEGRGYVLRRLIRRATRHGRILGITDSFITEVGKSVIESYGDHYPELKRDKDRIFKIIKSEEEKFRDTILQGLEKLNELIDRYELESIRTINGTDAFKLYDTYGFPLDFTREIAEEKGLAVDDHAFHEMMREQKERSRASRSDDGGWTSDEEMPTFKSEATNFTGYDTLLDNAVVLELFKGTEAVNQLSAGDEGMLITDRTPFYAQGGGQVGDIGKVSGEGLEVDVKDTKKDGDGVYIHRVKVNRGTINVGDGVNLAVAAKGRRATMKNHSAVHLLHKALRMVLGEHVNQAGSYVDSKRLRFDFTHFEGVSSENLKKVESIVNAFIEENYSVVTKEMTMPEANAVGAIGLFEDKYKDIVRVVRMGEVSSELCGGTHVSATGEIQMFKILSESGVAAGIRRIEAITAHNVYEYMLGLSEIVTRVSANLKTNTNEVVKKSEQLVEELKKKDKEIERIRFSSESSGIDGILNAAQEVGGVKFISHQMDSLDMETLRKFADTLRDKLNSGVVVLSSVNEGKLVFLATVTKDLIKKGLNAGSIVREVAKVAGGNGGGRPDFATAGGKDISKAKEALKNVRELIEAGITK